MGVHGLLPFLSDVTFSDNIRNYAGKRVVLDGFCFLHKAVIPIAQRLTESEEIDFYAHFLADICISIRVAGVEPIIVFDGGLLPMKKEEEARRAEKRAEALTMARAALRRGQTGLAHTMFKRATKVTPFMVKRTFDYLSKLGFYCIIAPYEADAQLAFLCRRGLCDLVITEDSDLLVFGAPRVMFKFQKGDGSGMTVRCADIPRAANTRGMDFERFRAMCVLSGCDYLDSPRGIGLKTAAKLLAAYGTVPHTLGFLQRAGRVKHLTPPSYGDLFAAAELTFRFQTVFDPVARECTPLNPFSRDDRAHAKATARRLVESDTWRAGVLGPDPLGFLGRVLPAALACDVAFAQLNARTLREYRQRRPVDLKPGHRRTRPRLPFPPSSAEASAASQPDAERTPLDAAELKSDSPLAPQSIVPVTPEFPRIQTLRARSRSEAQATRIDRLRAVVGGRGPAPPAKKPASPFPYERAEVSSRAFLSRTGTIPRGLTFGNTALVARTEALLARPTRNASSPPPLSSSRSVSPCDDRDAPRSQTMSATGSQRADGFSWDFDALSVDAPGSPSPTHSLAASLPSVSPLSTPDKDPPNAAFARPRVGPDLGFVERFRRRGAS